MGKGCAELQPTLCKSSASYKYNKTNYVFFMWAMLYNIFPNDNINYLYPSILFKWFFCSIKYVDVYLTMNATNAAVGGELPMQ